MRDYIARAYRMKLYQVTGPDWLTSERFDVNAKLPEGSTQEQRPEMLQSLLEERFQIKLHREKKELPVYALTIGKPPLKIQESAPDPDAAVASKGTANVTATGSADGVSVDLGNGSYYTFNNGKFEIKKVTMDMLARQLERYVDRPILDMTDLKGTYDLTDLRRDAGGLPDDADSRGGKRRHDASPAGSTTPGQQLDCIFDGWLAAIGLENGRAQSPVGCAGHRSTVEDADRELTGRRRRRRLRCRYTCRLPYPSIS